MDSLALIIGIGAGVTSCLTFFGGLLAYWKSAAKKEYASERDIGHLKNSMKSLTANQEELWRQNDERFDTLQRKIELIEFALLGKISSGQHPGHDVGKPRLD